MAGYALKRLMAEYKRELIFGISIFMLFKYYLFTRNLDKIVFIGLY